MRYRIFVCVCLFLLAPLYAQNEAPQADALLIYRKGRDLESAGRMAEAAAKYRESIAICDAELANDATRMDAYTVKCWNLFRLANYNDVITTGSSALKVRFDARIVEVMGEAFFYLNDDARALRYLQRYIDNVGEYSDRVPSAYFFMAESYARQKRFDHADIAYSLAVHREPSIARWWYRYGLVVEQLGDYAKAYDLYSKAVGLSPSMSDAVSAKERVRQLR